MFDGLGFQVNPDRSIHDEKSISFLELLGAGDWHTTLLKNGLPLEWEAGPPGPYFEDNNKSTLNNLGPLKGLSHEIFDPLFIFSKNCLGGPIKLSK